MVTQLAILFYDLRLKYELNIARVKAHVCPINNYVDISTKNIDGILIVAVLNDKFEFVDFSVNCSKCIDGKFLIDINSLDSTVINSYCEFGSGLIPV